MSAMMDELEVGSAKWYRENQDTLLNHSDSMFALPPSDNVRILEYLYNIF